MATACASFNCQRPGTVTGVNHGERVWYCREDAATLWLHHDFVPDDAADLHRAPALDRRQQQILARFEAAPPAPESFDAVAAVRRIQALVEELEERVARAAILLPDYERGRFDGMDDERYLIARRIRNAIRGDAA